MITGLPNLKATIFRYQTKPEMDKVYNTLTTILNKMPEITILKAWNHRRPPYPWMIAILCKDKDTLGEVDKIIRSQNVNTGDAETYVYASEERVQDFFTLMLIGKNEPGIVRVEARECPLGATSPMQCQFCMAGHMTECHYPLTCEQAKCSHLSKYME